MQNEMELWKEEKLGKWVVSWDDTNLVGFLKCDGTTLLLVNVTTNEVVLSIENYPSSVNQIWYRAYKINYLISVDARNRYINIYKDN